MALERTPFEVNIDTLSHDGRGVARVGGKTVFVEEALPGETVVAVRVGRRRKFDEARLVKVLRASRERVEPRCPHFGVCGGCALQHISPAAQLEHKQRVLQENLRRIGKVGAEHWLPPMANENPWQYRRRARLGVKYVFKKERILVGFRERRKPYIADMQSCDVLVPEVGKRIPELAELVRALSIFDRVPQIEVAQGDNATALVFRVLKEPTKEDQETLRQFSRQHGMQIWLQRGGPESVIPLDDEEPGLAYEIPSTGSRVEFRPNDFIQVNAEINLAVIARILELFEGSRRERVLDLFCGLGNFSLPLASRFEEVVGVDGESALVKRARTNASLNGIDNARFHTANLFENFDQYDWSRLAYPCVLLDPPRAGAEVACRYLGRIQPRRIVYVSCHPATLARDAGILVNEAGYRLVEAGVVDMFPHTAHIEAIAIFER